MGHTSDVYAVAFSPDGKKVLTGSFDNTAKLWDIETDAIEDKVYLFSLYDVTQAGFQIETSDLPEYRRDSIAYFYKLKQDSIYNEQKNAILESLRSQYDAQMDSLAKAKGLIWNKTSGSFQEKAGTTEGRVENNVIEELEQAISDEPDTTKKYSLYGILIDTLTKRWKIAPEDYADDLANAHSERGWFGFFLKKFSDTENDIRTGISIDSTNKYLNPSLAPALLLQGKYKLAEAEYQKWKDKPFDEQNLPNYRDAFLDDLNTLEKAGIIPKERMKDVQTIRALLMKKE